MKSLKVVYENGEFRFEFIVEVVGNQVRLCEACEGGFHSLKIDEYKILYAFNFGKLTVKIYLGSELVKTIYKSVKPRSFREDDEFVSELKEKIDDIVTEVKNLLLDEEAEATKLRCLLKHEGFQVE